MSTRGDDGIITPHHMETKDASYISVNIQEGLVCPPMVQEKGDTQWLPNKNKTVKSLNI